MKRPAISHGRRRRFGAASFLWLNLAVALLAARAVEPYLATNAVDSIALLPPPPSLEAVEQATDLAAVHAAFEATPEDERWRAEREAPLVPERFAPVIGEWFDTKRLPKTAHLLERAKLCARAPVAAAKEHWKRPRPYELDARLRFGGKPESTWSYPSGHSTVGTLQALVLAELFPERREAILAIGRRIGWDRVRTAKHFPSDVYAGRTLGQAIFRALQTNAAFQRDLEAARAEVTAAQRGTISNPAP
ncbi:MAG: phosphatase PAP2 family protein [Verrucomicrobiae bacterium]|nr:phosphatase PAP2 family protein [Verrucomicrobiae bacterium]MDW8309617.1 phosphatase PAP2 family protein [Verrucomicrobiales bacterium]